MRKLACICKINSIEPINSCDNIELARIKGWQAVVKKGEYSEGDKVIFCEIDSWIPQNISPFPCTEKYKGVTGFLVKTKKIRGVISQGLVLPTNILDTEYDEGTDLTHILGIQKWEDENQGDNDIIGDRPDVIPSTDIERIQNIDTQKIKNLYKCAWEITEKLDGTSMTIYYDGDKIHLCTKNKELNLNPKHKTVYHTYCEETGIFEIIKKFYPNFIFQGELIGEKIQKNRYKLSYLKWMIFSIWDVANARFLKHYEMEGFVNGLMLYLNKENQKQIGTVKLLLEAHIKEFDVNELLHLAEGKSVLDYNNDGIEREGIVLRCTENLSYKIKAISNKYLTTK